MKSTYDKNSLNLYEINEESNEKIDLKTEDLPHENSNSEWWYFNFHFETESKEKYSLFFCFFRVKAKEKKAETHYFIIYLLVDHQKKTHQSWSVWDTRLPAEASRQIRKRNKKNNTLLNYLAEILEKGEIIAPDILCPIDFRVEKENIYAKFGNSSFIKRDGLYFITINHDSLSLKFTVTMEEPVVRHGINGYTLLSGSPDDERMFYYFMPKGKVTGVFNQSRVTGIAWYDHEYSVTDNEKEESAEKKGWLWFSIQMDNKTQFSVYQIFNRKTHAVIERIAKFIDAQGHCYTFTNFSIEEIAFWQSSRTLSTYPIKWYIAIKELDLQLTIEAMIKDQEIITLLGDFAFYEGGVNITGKMHEENIQGIGFIEQYGLNEDVLLKSKNIVEASSKFTLTQVNDISLPETLANPGFHLIKDKLLAAQINNLPYEKIYGAGIEPLRDMLLRRGKAWRSFFLMVCINAVGGNSEDFREWPAIGEIVQSSSLIIDDIQDHAESRRGKKAIHKLYGIEKAINAGLLGNFIFNSLMNTTQLSSEQLVEIYTIYFNTAMGSVIGQCADIAGMQDILLKAIDTGDNRELRKTIKAMHTLKTGVAVKSLAQIGTILGNGSKEQIEKIGEYGLNIGLAFQYIDDLRAYTGDAKSLEEDVMSGKITLPMAIAIPRLTNKQKKWLGQMIVSKNRDDLQALVNLFNETGVIEECKKEAKAIVTQAWKETESVIDTSIYKALLHYLGIFALEIHLKQKQ